MASVKRVSLWLCFILAVYISGSRPAVAAKSSPNPQNNSNEIVAQFGINGGKAFHVPHLLETDVNQRIQWMQELGVKYDRSDWWFHVIEPEKGRFDFTVPDKILKYYEDRNQQIYPILCYGAAWWKDRTAPRNDEEMDEFADYVTAVMTRYKGKFPYWSVWNEPNLAQFWSPEPDPVVYTRLLKKVAEAARKADPDTRLCAPVTAPLPRWDKKFIEAVYRNGGKDYFDVFDYHYYRNNPPEEEVPRELDEIRALMHRYGDDHKPIWISETGVSSPITLKPKSYSTQAELIARNHLLCYASGVKRILYFDLQNWMDDSSQPWDGCLGLVQANGEKKPSFYAYQTLIKELDGKTIIGRYPGFEPGIEAVLIYDELKQEYNLAVWCREDFHRRTVMVTCESTVVPVTDLYGITKMVATNKLQGKRQLSLNISEAVQYVHQVDKFTYLPETQVRFNYNLLEMAPGEEQSVRITEVPRLKDFSFKILQVSVPEGISWNRKRNLINAADNITSGQKILKAKLEISFRDDSGDLKVIPIERTLEINIIPTLNLRLRPHLDEEGKVMMDINMGNTISASRDKSLQDIRRKYKQPLYVKEIYNATTTVLVTDNIFASGKLNPKLEFSYPLMNHPFDQYTTVFKWIAEFNGFQSKPMHIYPVKYSEQGPEIDGDLNDWKTVPYMTINRKDQITRGAEGWTPKNASVEAQLWMTKDTVYFAAQVYDNAPVNNPYAPVEMWRGDAFELYLGFGGPTRRTIIDKSREFQIGIAPVTKEGKPMVFKFHEDKILQDALIIVKKTSVGYNLEVAIPFSRFGQYKLDEGILIGLDLALDDLDEGDTAPAGNDPGRALMWNGGNMNWIDPSGWGIGILTKK